MLPSQACTWRKTLAECSFADASVGGRFSAISFILLLSVIAEIHNHGYVFLVIAFGREPWDQSELPPPTATRSLEFRLMTWSACLNE